MNGKPAPSPLRIVVVGLSLSSSWGNGHATTYRALLGALAQRGHDILFLERDQTWYAEHRDLAEPDFCRLRFYETPTEMRRYRPEIERADLVMIGSYVADGVAVAKLVRPWASTLAFYDIDTPVTLALLKSGKAQYISADIIPLFDLYLSFTGGPTLNVLEQQFGAKAARALYCAVDPALYAPLAKPIAPSWHLGYLGTYSADRQPMLERLLMDPARAAPELRFVVAGPQYPDTIEWPGNVERMEHLPPSQHADFYTSQAWTLNITRADMVSAGYSPSVRLFEASACATPIISDRWAGLDTILSVGREIMVADTCDDVLALLRFNNGTGARVGAAARARVLREHTAEHRALTLEALVASYQGTPILA